MTQQTTEDRTVSEVMVDMLARAGVRHLFGVAGSSIMPLLDALESDGRIEYVGARYELSAAEMASGYARATSRLGIVMTHVGPGATSVITAMAGAVRDGVPMLLITGNEESETLSRQPYHDWDLMAVMAPLTAFSYRITRPDELPHVLRRALGEALRGVARPVHIDLPEDIGLLPVDAATAAGWLATIEPVLASMAAARAIPLSRPAPSPEEVGAVVELLAGAQRPMVMVGESIHMARDLTAFYDLCDELGIPYATTFGARGGVGSRKGYVGSTGRFGSKDTTALLGRADVVLTLGAEMTDVDTTRWRVPSPEARIVAVHSDAGKIDRRFAPTIGVMADMEEFLRAVVPAALGRGLAVDPAWLADAAAVDRSNGPVGAPAKAPDAPLDAQLVARMIEGAPDSWVVACDPGFAPLTLSAPADFGGTRFLYAYGMGAMGFSVPALLGATTADGVDGGIAVIGDGSLFMSLSSLESVASLGRPVVVLVLDDGGFGSQRKKQQEGYGRNVGVDYVNPDIAAIGAAMGIESMWIESTEDIDRLVASLPGRTTGALAVVKRDRVQKGTWYEGSMKRR